MIIVAELLLLAVGLAAIVALVFRVRCPPEHALVFTNRTEGNSLRGGPPAYSVLAERGAFRLPSAGAVDLLDLSPFQFDAFVPLIGNGSKSGEVQAIAQARVCRRAAHLRRAAVRMMGMSRCDLDALGEGSLVVALRNAVEAYSREEAVDSQALESAIRAELETLFDELGLEIVELHLQLKWRSETSTPASQ